MGLFHKYRWEVGDRFARKDSPNIIYKIDAIGHGYPELNFRADVSYDGTNGEGKTQRFHDEYDVNKVATKWQWRWWRVFWVVSTRINPQDINTFVNSRR